MLRINSTNQLNFYLATSLKLCLKHSRSLSSPRVFRRASRCVQTTGPPGRDYVGDLVITNRTFDYSFVRSKSDVANGESSEGWSVSEMSKDEIGNLLNRFAALPILNQLEDEYGLDTNMSRKALVGFKKFCLGVEKLPLELQIIMSDVTCGSGVVDDIFPYFLKHARSMFPLLECMDDLKRISDLREPADWFPKAREKVRKIIYHAGPTNSGKTHRALERFVSAKSGVYCGPLRLLASEIFKKTNDVGTQCDLITGEERKHVDESGMPSNHQACTVEMTDLDRPVEVAVIDEIQMIRDLQRGWAWTRAFLGICADEVHVCGEESGIDLIRDLTIDTGDLFEVIKYERLTKLKIDSRGIDSFDRIKAGDCIICFNKKDIYHVTRQLEKRKVEVAVIYGTLPPATKIAQADKFNDPNNPCKVMVATDAVGMGLNLNIKRLVFYSLMKMTLNDEGDVEIDLISPSLAKQIAGRAGRFSSQFTEGEVTTFKTSDLHLLRRQLSTPIESIETAGLIPIARQIETFGYYLPKASLSELIAMFMKLCEVDNKKYFMCNMDNIKFLADIIQHIPLNVEIRYLFCCAPIPKGQPIACAMFLRFAKQFSKGQLLTGDWLCRQIGWPFRPPETIKDLVHIEGIFDVFDLYLWLSYRFPDMFPHPEEVRGMQKELEMVIQSSLINIVRLLEQDQTGFIDNEDEFDISSKTKCNQSSPVEDDSDPPQLQQQQRRQDQKKSGGLKIDKEEKMELDRRFRAAIKAGGRLTDQAIKQGLLTKEIVQKLEEEILSEFAKQQQQQQQQQEQQQQQHTSTFAEKDVKSKNMANNNNGRKDNNKRPKR